MTTSLHRVDMVFQTLEADNTVFDFTFKVFGHATVELPRLHDKNNEYGCRHYQQQSWSLDDRRLQRQRLDDDRTGG